MTWGTFDREWGTIV